jgi:3-oxoacyl-[acyl-carrier protein] reductase
MTNIPAAVLGGQTDTRRIRLSTELVDRFAAITGDRSPLHVDDAFARRSAYRQRVVHGMLPIAAVASLDSLAVEGLRAVPVSLSARFLSPVFPDDTLVVSRSAGSENADGHLAVDFRITRDGAEAPATTGTLTIRFEPRNPLPGTAGESTSMTESSELHSYHLDDIHVDDTDALRITIGLPAVLELARLLADAAGDDGVCERLPQAFHLPNLMAILEFSTSIGVSLPGATATFLDFSARVERDVEIDAAYVLRGRVTQRSLATRIVKKELLLTPEAGDAVLVRGKASTLVTAPSATMPGIAELRAEGTDLGLRGKVVLVTGASRGIGETVAKLFALHGSRVVVNYHRGAADAQRVVEEIISVGGEALAVQADVANGGEVHRLIDRAREHFGGIDVLVNNAARDYRPAPFLRTAWEDVQRDIEVVVKGAFLCCQGVIPLMLERGGGRIINISTLATDNPPPDQSKYVIAKSALVGLTRSLAVEFAGRNVLVNMVAPNFVETDFVAHVGDGFRKKIAREIPMQRAASPAEVARAVVILASSYASFTTGQKIMVTGGSAPFL